MMADIIHALANLHSPEGIAELIKIGGLFILTAIVFSETGLLAGFFLPGDSLLVTAGVFCSKSLSGAQPILDLSEVLITLSLAAIIGDQFGYFLGLKSGPKIFSRPNSRFFKQAHLQKAHDFYEKHGVKSIIIARFLPIFRTFVPFVAGMAKMNYRRFVAYNIVGGVLWVHSLVLLGYFIGLTPLGKKLHLVIIVVIFVSILPMIIGGLRHLFKRRALTKP